MENNYGIGEHKREVPVLITFAFTCDEGDGQSTERFRITEEEYVNILDYYAHPYAHYIGVMINSELPRIKQMVEDEVSWYADDIFIERIELDESEDVVIEA